MTYPVKWYRQTMTGAPTGTNDSIDYLLAVLDGCLINGFNQNAVDSLTYDSNINKCTLTINAGHGFIDYQVILIEGANETGFNGEQRVVYVSPTQLQFVPQQTPQSATATGTITVKAAPAGNWEKAFSGPSKGVYRSLDPTATGFYLKADTGRGYVTMTDVDTGTEEFGVAPFSGIRDGWSLVCDSKCFYFFMGEWEIWGFFGDINSFVPADGYHCAIVGNKESSLNQINGMTARNNNTAQGKRIARDYSQVTINQNLLNNLGEERNFDFATLNNLICSGPIMAAEMGNIIRGIYPGAYRCNVAVQDLTGIYDVTIDGTPRKLLVGYEKNAVTQYINTNGYLAFDLTGPWR